MKRSIIFVCFFCLLLSSVYCIAGAEGSTEQLSELSTESLTDTVPDTSSPSQTIPPEPETSIVFVEYEDPDNNSNDYLVIIAFGVSVLIGIAVAKAFSFWKW